tara:strand:- start:271 stop:705 length:435 start_codon:yes stop_codon:yes gene_type:complete
MEVFDDLISAIQEAVIRAHESSEQQHVRMMSRFFNEETGEPETVKVNLPYLDPHETEVQYKEVHVPTLCLVPFNSIKIKDIEVSAEVEFQNVKSDGGGRKLSARLRGGGFGRKANRAKIKVTVEGGDPPEALLKLNDTLVKILP